MVGCFGNPAVLTEDKGIVVVLAGRFCYVKSVPDLKTFDGTDGHDRLGKVRIKLLEDRISDAGGHPLYDTLHNAAGGIQFRHAGIQIVFGVLGCLGVRHIERILRDFGKIKTIGRYGDRADGFCVGHKGNAELV